MRVAAWLLGLCVLGIAPVASAQQVPAERVGFQMALRTGYAMPMGDVTEQLEMSDLTAWQLPLFVEIGGKVSPNVFVGGYLGFAFGAPDGGADEDCDGLERCLTVGVRVGAEVQYHILPRGSANPWIGYGIGFESLALAMEAEDDDDDAQTVSFNGFEYARLSAGVDFRLTRVFGLGPFVDFSVGEYTGYDFDTELVDEDGDIDNGAAHQWLTLGIRGVFFP